MQDGWQPDADHAAAMQAMTDDPLIFWCLAGSEAVGAPLPREVRRWPNADIAEALLVLEAHTEASRYARVRAEHDAAARGAR